MKKSDNMQLKMDIGDYLRALVKMRVETVQLLSYTKKHPKMKMDGQTVEKMFEERLDMLYNQYFDKFENRDDVERPEFAEDEMLGKKMPRDVSELSFTQKKVLFRTLAELQEKLGHTTIEGNEWVEDPI